MIKRLYVSVIVLILMAGALAGCNSGNEKGNANATAAESSTVAGNETAANSDTANTSEPVKLRLFTLSALDKDEFDLAYPEWLKLHPNIQVEMVVLSGEDSADKIRVAIAGGEMIDIVYMENESFRDKSSKLYYRLNDLIKEDGMDYSEMFGSYGQSAMSGDDIYGLPKSLAPSAVWVNKEHFANAGVALPKEDWTVAEYFDTVANLQKSYNGQPGAYGGIYWLGALSGIQDLALYSGWDIVDENGAPNIDDPRLKQAAQYYYDALFTHKSIPTEADLAANKITPIFEFVKGNIGAMLGASNSAMFMDVWKVQGHLTEEMDAKSNFDLVSPPRWDESQPANQITGTVVSFAISSSTEHPKEAFQFLKWWVTDALVLSSKIAHRFPAWSGADKNLLAENWRFYKDANGELVQGKLRDELYGKALDPKFTMIFSPYRGNFAYSSMFLEELNKELSLVLANEKSIDDALADAQKASEDIYAKEKNNSRE